MQKRTWGSRKRYPDDAGEKVSSRERLVGRSHRLRASGSPNARSYSQVPHPLKMPVLREGKHPVYLLSDHVGIMASLNLEGAIVRP